MRRMVIVAGIVIVSGLAGYGTWRAIDRLWPGPPAVIGPTSGTDLSDAAARDRFETGTLPDSYARLVRHLGTVRSETFGWTDPEGMPVPLVVALDGGTLSVETGMVLLHPGGRPPERRTLRLRDETLDGVPDEILTRPESGPETARRGPPDAMERVIWLDALALVFEQSACCE